MPLNLTRPEQIVVKFIIDGADALPPVERADVYDATADLFECRSAALASEARMIADHLRSAEQRQLTFRNILAATLNGDPS